MLTQRDEPVIYATQIANGVVAVARSIVSVYGITAVQAGTGGVREWLKRTDCKSVDLVYVGSNPTSSTTGIWKEPRV